MEIRPILSSLRKHKIPVALIVLEIALSCAVLCNAIFMISQRINASHTPDAIDESGLTIFQMNGANPKFASSYIPRNLAALRRIPGVTAAAAFNEVPLSNSSWNVSISNKPTKPSARGGPNVTTYMFTKGGPKAFGMQLLKGRWFNAAEYANANLGGTYLPVGHVVVITRSLAQRLWPGQAALGKQVWVGNQLDYTVIGVTADVLRPNRNGMGPAGFHWAMFFPMGPSQYLNNYIVRSAPPDRARILHAGVEKLQALSPNAVIKGRTFSSIRTEFFATTRSMIWMLTLVCAVMLAVTAFGIVGLTSFWVRQRRRQIGIRRAVGANRRQILNYFQTENFLLSTAGVVIGMILAFGINLYLMQHYQLDHMPWFYLPVSAIALWILGQLAVLGPALRASRVPPVVATRGA